MLGWESTIKRATAGFCRHAEDLVWARAGMRQTACKTAVHVLAADACGSLDLALLSVAAVGLSTTSSNWSTCKQQSTAGLSNFTTVLPLVLTAAPPSCVLCAWSAGFCQLFLLS